MTDSVAQDVRRIAIKLAALGQDGLTYATGERAPQAPQRRGAERASDERVREEQVRQCDYDLDRYRQVADLAAALLALISARPVEELTLELGRDSGYATPKVDVRGAIFDDLERV